MPVLISSTPYLYFPVPKVACTSIKKGILQHNDPETLARHTASSAKLDVHKIYPSYRFKPWIARIKWPRTEWICMVRDPVKRAVSGYRNRILFHRDLEKTPEAVLEKSGLTRTPDLNEFSRDLEKYCKVSTAVNHHFALHCRYLGTQPQQFSHVFKLSEMGDLVSLVANAGVTLDIPHEQTGGPKVSVDDLSREGRAALETFYAKDYRTWGPYFD